MNALEVLINGKIVGVFVPPDGSSICAMVANVPKTHARAQIFTSSDLEDWQWQLPDLSPGEMISFRWVAAPVGSGVPPRSIKARDPREVTAIKNMAKKAAANARRRMAAKRKRNDA